MRGIAIFAVLCLAVTAYAQGPATRTKKGSRPVRRGDNTDRGLPSGADVPDGRRMAPPAAAAPAARPAGRPMPPPAAKPAGRPAPPPAAPAVPAAPRAAPAAPAFPAAPAAPAAPGPVPMTRTRSGPPPAGRMIPRRGDNTDRGLPSGADVPDGRRFPVYGAVPAVPAAAPAARPVPVAQPQPMFNPFAAMFGPAPPAVPAAPAVPAMSCQASCQYFWSPVCSVNGNTYDNDCRLGCSGEAYACEGECPCEEPKAAPQAPLMDPFFGYVAAAPCNCNPYEYDPVCTDDGDQYNNKCLAQCEGKTIACSSSCPC